MTDNGPPSRRFHGHADLGEKYSSLGYRDAEPDIVKFIHEHDREAALWLACAMVERLREIAGRLKDIDASAIDIDGIATGMLIPARIAAGDWPLSLAWEAPGLSNRARWALLRAGRIECVEWLSELIPMDLAGIQGCGRKTRAEIEAFRRRLAEAAGGTS
jgi:hypothetical protein